MSGVDFQALQLCLQMCGICPQVEDADRIASLPVLQDVDPEMPAIEDVWLTVYTDGAATRASPDDPSAQRAGYAVVNATSGCTFSAPAF